MAHRDRFPAWFDAARFRQAFVIEPAGLPLAETFYSAVPLPPGEGLGVDVTVECTDDRGDLRVQLWRRIETVGGVLVATHAVFAVHDDPSHPSIRFQRQGIARRSFRRALALYDDLGVRRVVLAATNAGRYVWPKFGFRLQAGARTEFVSVVRAEYRRVFGQELTDAIPDSGRRLVELRQGHYPLGMVALGARSAWNMQLDLTDSRSRSILDEELQR